MLHPKSEQKTETITFPEAEQEILPSDLLTDEDLLALENGMETQDPDGQNGKGENGSTGENGNPEQGDKDDPDHEPDYHAGRWRGLFLWPSVASG